MEDLQIIELFWQRSESAVTETARKYGRYCHTIAYNILHSREDSEECVNDTYLNAWRTIPPQRPERLSTFLGKITRNLSLKRWEQYHAEKRGAGQTALALDELAECVPASDNVEQPSAEPLQPPAKQEFTILWDGVAVNESEGLEPDAARR